MKATLIQNERIKDVRKKRQQVRQHDAFAVIQSQRLECLPLSKLQLPDDPREARRRIVRSYTQSMQQIHTLHRDLGSYLDAVVECFVWVGQNDSGMRLYQEKLNEVKRGLPRVSLQVVDSLFAEIMVNEPPEIATTLLRSLDETIAGLLRGLQTCLQSLQSERVVGRIAWFSTDVCRYDFYRIKRSERLVDSTTEKRQEVTLSAEAPNPRMETVYEITDEVNVFGKTDLLEHHQHELFNAKRYQLPAKQVRQPRFIQRFVPKVPLWLAPHHFVVEGDMLRETVQSDEQQVSYREERHSNRTIIRQGWLYSPAVTLGDFVLTGWSGRDV